FLSSSDIDKGARWRTEIASRLEKAKAGIICLTPSNMQSEWILFEAGALSKTLADTYVCTLLIDMKPTDVTGPLAQFQATTTSEADMLQLVKTLNSKLGESGVPPAQLEKAFKLMWPELNKQIENLPKEEGTKAPGRSAEDMLEELLILVRNLSRSSDPRMASNGTPLHLAVQRVLVDIFREELGDRLHDVEWADSPSDELAGYLAYRDLEGKPRARTFQFSSTTTTEDVKQWLKTLSGEKLEIKSDAPKV
ncbi:MAG TPA: hypothetical protein VNB54_03170, partial [Alphaproteobacteria bacterium]|nr:hypothetical protein [Alphaproteobacteria bacterium]